MKAVLVNASKGYNLGLHKLAGWLRSQGYDHVQYFDGDPGLFALDADLICLSVIFSWDAPKAKEIANIHKSHADIWCGGPGMFALSNWWKKETGLDCVKGLDQRFENYYSGYGYYDMTFASRGCPVDCSFCIVPRIEGTEFTLNWDFNPAPVLCDNNISALPVEFQEHIIQKYKEWGVPLMDANSGFEPMSFDEETYLRWKPILKGPWRFAYDTTSEKEPVKKMIRILEDEHRNNKKVYVLIGNEPIDQCVERVHKVIEWGGLPHVQPMMALNALEKKPMIKYDWTERKLKDLARWSNRWIWRKTPLKEYAPRKDGVASFP